MAIATLTYEQPILAVGLPRPQLDALRLAGVPLRVYRSGTSIYEFLQQEPGRFVLYDSRRITSRLEAETALGLDREILDISPEAGRSPALTHEFERHWPRYAAEWMIGLKEALTLRGGLWMRLHELPHGYEGVVFANGLPREPELTAVAESLWLVSKSASTLQGPHFGLDHVLSPDASSLFEARFGCWWHGRSSEAEVRCGAPNARIWSTHSPEFRDWWKYRNSIRMRIRQQGTSVQIEAFGFDARRPGLLLEFWWNEHVARIPLTDARFSIRMSDLAFAREPFRHPAGLLVSQGRSAELASSSEERVSAPLVRT